MGQASSHSTACLRPSLANTVFPPCCSVSSPGNKQELCQKIMEGRYTAPDHLSVNAKDLLARMLTVDPEKRITFEQVRMGRGAQGCAAVMSGEDASTVSACWVWVLLCFWCRGCLAPACSPTADLGPTWH